MKQVLMVKLAPSAEHRITLIATMERFNAACDALAIWAADHSTHSKWTIQAACYRNTRETFGLSAQLTVRAIAKAAQAQDGLPEGKAAKFRPHGAVVYDSRIMSFKGIEAVSLSTVEGRVLVPMRLGDYQRSRINRQRGEADLILREGVFYLAICLDAPESDQFDATGTLGVDLGIVNLATDSDGETYSGEGVEQCRVRYTKRRSVLQSVGTRSSRRRLAKIRRREARFRADTNHVISKQIVGKAQHTKRQIAVEELTGINARIRVRRPQRSRQSGWAYAQLRAFIAYKALLAGVPLVAVNPRDTSRECFECGHTEKANRQSQSKFVCRSCGHVAPADTNAARNIARKAEVMRPTVPLEMAHAIA